MDPAPPTLPGLDGGREALSRRKDALKISKAVVNALLAAHFVNHLAAATDSYIPNFTFPPESSAQYHGTMSLRMLPNEVRSMIVRLLDRRSRNALAKAVPSWKDVATRENYSVFAVDYEYRDLGDEEDDPEDLDIPPLFSDSEIRNRRYIKEVEVLFYIWIEGSGKCCLVTEDNGYSGVIARQIRDLFTSLEDFERQVGDEGLTPICLTFVTCEKTPIYYKCLAPHVEERHKPRQVEEAIVYQHALEPESGEDNLPELKGVDEFVFNNDEALAFLEPDVVPRLMKRLVNLRKIRLDFEEDELWQPS
ncbi:hypothetical protein VTK56DRAFT_4461 [Thermocarpiscus australiensis]